jgi:ABC-type uncharacterized transport system ATPase subunit
MKIRTKTIALFLILAMGLTNNPLQSNAKYKDQSGNLPGTVSDGTIYALAGVAVVGVGALIYVLIKKKQNKTASVIEYRNNMQAVSWEKQLTKTSGIENSVSTIQSNETNGSSTISVIPDNTFMQQIENASKTIPVNLIISPLSTGNNFALSNSNGVQVGVRIRF